MSDYEDPTCPACERLLERVECPWCNGFGEGRDHRMGYCPKCRGHGRIWVCRKCAKHVRREPIPTGP